MYCQAQGTLFLTILPCVAGYKLVNSNGIFTCQCDLDADYIVQCESDQVTILLEVNRLVVMNNCFMLYLLSRICFGLFMTRVILRIT